jgi:hypothetical protein
VNRTPPQSRKVRSLTHPHSVTDSYMLWRCIDIQDRECLTARMAQQIKHQLGDTQPKLVFQFDCASRGKMMFRDQERRQLLGEFRQSVGPDAPWVGFYTYGEIGPVATHNLRHIYTAVVLALS